MATAQDLITTFQRTYPDCDNTRSLQILNEIDEEISWHIPLRRKTTDIAFVNGTSEYLLDVSVLKIWSARLIGALATTQTPLIDTTIDYLDIQSPGWRSRALGTPTEFYISNNDVQGVIGMVSGPNFSTPVVSTVITQTDVAPKLTIDYSYRTSLALTSVMPITPQVRWLYVDGMRMLYAREKDRANLQLSLAAFNESLAEQSQLVMQRSARVQPQIQVVNQVSNWRGRASGKISGRDGGPADY